MKTLLAFYALYFLLILLGFAGYVLNIIDVVSGFVNNEPFTTLFIGRIIGLFAFPLGAILGWF